jgi:hypothetical protein
MKNSVHMYCMIEQLYTTCPFLNCLTLIIIMFCGVAQLINVHFVREFSVD